MYVCFLSKVLSLAKRECVRVEDGNRDHLSFTYVTLLSRVREHKAHEIVIYEINERNFEGIAGVTDSNFSLERNRAITSYVVRVNSHVSVYMHFCVPS